MRFKFCSKIWNPNSLKLIKSLILAIEAVEPKDASIVKAAKELEVSVSSPVINQLLGAITNAAKPLLKKLNKNDLVRQVRGSATLASEIGYPTTSKTRTSVSCSNKSPGVWQTVRIMESYGLKLSLFGAFKNFQLLKKLMEPLQGVASALKELKTRPKSDILEVLRMLETNLNVDIYKDLGADEVIEVGDLQLKLNEAKQMAKQFRQNLLINWLRWLDIRQSYDGEEEFLLCQEFVEKFGEVATEAGALSTKNQIRSDQNTPLKSKL